MSKKKQYFCCKSLYRWPIFNQNPSQLESRNYWLDTFVGSTEKTAQIALESQPNNADAQVRSEEFKRRYYLRLEELRDQPG